MATSPYHILITGRHGTCREVDQRSKTEKPREAYRALGFGDGEAAGAAAWPLSIRYEVTRERSAAQVRRSRRRRRRFVGASGSRSLVWLRRPAPHVPPLRDKVLGCKSYPGNGPNMAQPNNQVELWCSGPSVDQTPRLIRWRQAGRRPSETEVATGSGEPQATKRGRGDLF
jgi:hypothetical protein